MGHNKEKPKLDFKHMRKGTGLLLKFDDGTNKLATFNSLISEDSRAYYIYVRFEKERFPTVIAIPPTQCMVPINTNF